MSEMPQSDPPKSSKPVVVLGAGPAGLAAGYELALNGLTPVVLEKNDMVGGISRTEAYRDYLFDIGGHRFFTKSERIRRQWHEMIGSDFLTVNRKSRIYYEGKFFDYPLSAANALKNLGFVESLRILSSYFGAQLNPYSQEETFEQWVSNRFGRRLFETFFKTYTEKVWGIDCSEIRSDWAVQRIKGLSLIAAVTNALFGSQNAKSLIDRFEYPVLGPGMMWQRYQEAITQLGGRVLLNAEALRLKLSDQSVSSVTANINAEVREIPAEHVISSLAMPQLVSLMEPKVPDSVRKSAESLSFRSFIIVILIINRESLFSDQWIYIHNPDVRVGRIQNFKNWSAAMVPEAGRTSIGMEYFCSEGDPLWTSPDSELVEMAGRELEALGLADRRDVADSHVLRQPNAYPVYDRFYTRRVETIRSFLGSIENLQTVGRNGMHRYNNMDHSMLTGMLAAENVRGARHNLWEINEEKEYLEELPSVSDDRIGKAPEQALQLAFARIDKLAFATAVASVSGFLLFMATAWLVIKNGEVVGPTLQLLGQFFPGYTVSLKGAFVAFGYSFLWAFLLAWLFAYLRNLALAIYLYAIKKRAELLSLRDFFDQF